MHALKRFYASLQGCLKSEYKIKKNTYSNQNLSPV